MRRMENGHSLFQLLPEAVLKCLRPVEAPAGSALRGIVQSMLFVCVIVYVVILARAAADDSQRIEESLREVTGPVVRVVERIRYRAAGPRVLAQEVGSVCKSTRQFWGCPPRGESSPV